MPAHLHARIWKASPLYQLEGKQWRAQLVQICCFEPSETSFSQAAAKHPRGLGGCFFFSPPLFNLFSAFLLDNETIFSLAEYKRLWDSVCVCLAVGDDVSWLALHVCVSAFCMWASLQREAKVNVVGLGDLQLPRIDNISLVFQTLLLFIPCYSHL